MSVCPVTPGVTDISGVQLSPRIQTSSSIGCIVFNIKGTWVETEWLRRQVASLFYNNFTKRPLYSDSTSRSSFNDMKNRMGTVLWFTVGLI